MNSLLGPACAFLSSCTWAVGSSTYSKLSGRYSPFSINFSRALIALPSFLIVVLIANGGFGGAIAAYRDLPADRYAWFALSIFSSYALGDVFFWWSAQRIGITSALAIASAFPLVSTAFHLLSGGEVSSLQFAGLLLTVGGVVGVILAGSPDKTGEKRVGSRKMGVVFAGCTAVFWAMNAWSVMKGADGIDASLGNSIRMTIALALAALFSVAVEKKLPKLIDAAELKRTGWIFWMESFGGSFLFVYGLSHSSVVVGMTLVSLAPVLVVPVAVLMGVEKFSFRRTAAVALTVCGIFLLNFKN